MDYSLAKQLKDAGFPQRDDVHPDYKDNSLQWDGNRRDGYVYKPTIEELIATCGESLKTIDFLHDKNEVVAYSADSFDLDRSGISASEAVAKLWLALNAKPIN